MSFHSVLTGAAVWPADLATAGIVSAASRVYTGRRRQTVTHTDGEVWLEQIPTEQAGMGLQGLSRHVYLVHVYQGPFNAGPGKTGEAQLDAVEAKLETIAERYHGTATFVGTLTGITAIEANVETVDVDPELDNVIEGTVLVTFLVSR